MPKLPSRFGTKSRVAAGAVIVLALFLALFDWNWCKPVVERYLSKHSGREVRAGHMSLSGLLTLEPTVTFREVHVENAPWADTKQPFAVAGEAAFTFSIRSVIDERTVISLIVLKDADIDMQKQANGLRNWRLEDPDYTGPGEIRVLRLEAYRSKLRFAERDPARAFDIRFVSSEPAAAAKPFVHAIEAKGVYRGAKFSAHVLTGAVLSFRETGDYFPLRGHAVAGRTRLELDGKAADIFATPQLDAKVRVEGQTLSELHPFTLLRPARSRAYAFEARVHRDGNAYRFERVRGRIGETDLAGEGSHELRNERHLWRASLASASADLADLGTLAGIDYAPGGAPAERLFPRQQIKPDRLRAQDLQLRLELRKLKSHALASLESVKLEATLAGGLLEVKGLDAGVAGGHVTGQLSLDARANAPRGRAALRLAGLDLERLFPSLPGEARNTGPVRGAIGLEGGGDSIGAMLGNASGKVDLALDGGSLSNKLDAKLSLNLGKLAALVFKGDQAIPIHCAVAGFDFHGGIGKARALLVETAETRIEGTGTINLREERADLVLVPRPKRPGLLTLGSTIRVGGTLRHPSFDFQKGAAPGIASAAQCPAKAQAIAATR